jgi:hypothetical protein
MGDLINFSSILQILLCLQIINQIRFTKFNIFHRLLQGIPSRIKGDQALNSWPLFNGLTKNTFITKDYHIKKCRIKTSNNFSHWFRLCFLINKSESNQLRVSNEFKSRISLTLSIAQIPRTMGGPFFRFFDPNLMTITFNKKSLHNNSRPHCNLGKYTASLVFLCRICFAQPEPLSPSSLPFSTHPHIPPSSHSQ